MGRGLNILARLKHAKDKTDSVNQCEIMISNLPTTDFTNLTTKMLANTNLKSSEWLYL